MTRAALANELQEVTRLIENQYQITPKEWNTFKQLPSKTALSEILFLILELHDQPEDFSSIVDTSFAKLLGINKKRVPYLSTADKEKFRSCGKEKIAQIVTIDNIDYLNVVNTIKPMKERLKLITSSESIDDYVFLSDEQIGILLHYAKEASNSFMDYITVDPSFEQIKKMHRFLYLKELEEARLNTIESSIEGRYSYPREVVNLCTLESLCENSAELESFKKDVLHLYQANPFPLYVPENPQFDSLQEIMYLLSEEELNDLTPFVKNYFNKVFAEIQKDKKTNMTTKELIKRRERLTTLQKKYERFSPYFNL